MTTEHRAQSRKQRVPRVASCSLLCALCFLLSACSAAPPPDIAFIGVASGTLLTSREDLRFGNRFPETIHGIVGVAAFKEAGDGTRVQATWFSPDDRRMPLGRRVIVLQSGATVARFTLSNAEAWEPAPYMLDIRVYAPEDPDAPNVEAGSGQVQFFVGMDEEAIAVYETEFQEYQVREAEEKALQQERNQEIDALLAPARSALSAPEAIIALTADLTGDGAAEYVILDTRGEEAFVPSRSPALLLTAAVRGFAIVSSTGTLLHLRDDGPMHLIILPSGTVSITKDGETEEAKL